MCDQTSLSELRPATGPQRMPIAGTDAPSASAGVLLGAEGSGDELGIAVLVNGDDLAVDEAQEQAVRVVVRTSVVGDAVNRLTLYDDVLPLGVDVLDVDAPGPLQPAHQRAVQLSMSLACR